MVILNEEVSLDFIICEYYGDLNDRKVKMIIVWLRWFFDLLIDDIFYVKLVKLEMEFFCCDNVKINISLLF